MRFILDWGDSGSTYRIQIARLDLPPLQRSYQDLSIVCSRGFIETRRISCESGKLTLPEPLLDESEMSLGFELDRVSGRLKGRLGAISAAAGSLDLDFQLEGDQWALQAKGRGLQLSRLLDLWPPLRGQLADWDLAGVVALEAQLAGTGAEPAHGTWKANVSALSLSDAQGLYAGEGIAIRMDGKLDAAGAGWRVELALATDSGEILTPAFYLDAASHPLSVDGLLELEPKAGSLTLQDVTLRQPGLLKASLQGKLRDAGPQSIEWLKLRVDPLQAGDFYRELLQPVLAGTPWGSFEMAGEVGLALDLAQGAMRLDLGLQAFSIDDEESGAAGKRLGLYDLSGQLHWAETAPVETSRLSWQAGHLLENIELGAGELEFLAMGNALKLTRPARLPVLDGTLVVDRLELQALGSEAQKLEFDGLIEPISLAALSRALGWTPLSGKLSGMLPGLTYEQGLLSVDGVILMRVFDGDILIDQLQTRDLFGVYPQLRADVELRGLDLEGLTDTFAFGRITGRLDGYVRELRLEQWSPVSFDARFFTPPEDRSRRRISQQAVDNISNLGGAGMSGALARSFMRFFEEFSYKRIGIGCRLQNGICDMVGAGPAKQGYYLVEGSGIPRIDIIGFNTTADWEGLVDQLKQIATSGAPTVE